MQCSSTLFYLQELCFHPVHLKSKSNVAYWTGSSFAQQLEHGSTPIPTDSSVIATRPLKTHPCCLCLSQTLFSVFVLLTLAHCLPLMWNKGANKSWHTCAFFFLFLTPAPASPSRGIFSHYVWSVCHSLCVSMIIILCVCVRCAPTQGGSVVLPVQSLWEQIVTSKGTWGTQAAQLWGIPRIEQSLRN